MKIDIGLQRAMTINTGNYNSVKPGVSLVAHGVDDMDTKRVYKLLSNLTDAMFALETLKVMNEMDTIKTDGVSSYVRMLEGAKEAMEAELNITITLERND